MGYEKPTLTSNLANVPESPGVYLYYDDQDTVLYVGKAINLARRVKSYFQKHHTNSKTIELVKHIVRFEIMQTKDEYEALLLENTLIKQHRPKYNIALKDDKGYPWLASNMGHAFPGLAYHQGKQRQHMHYFGPYVAKKSVWKMLNQIQRLFKIRSCSDSYFQSRKRPCMLYQIKRCSGPCVGLITKGGYARDFDAAMLFLKGQSIDLLNTWQDTMFRASKAQDYETAQAFRDLIRDYHAIVGKHAPFKGDASIDVWGYLQHQNTMHLLLLWVRGGQMLGKQMLMFRPPEWFEAGDAVKQYLCQYYLNGNVLHGLPNALLIDLAPHLFKEIASLIKQKHGHKVVAKSMLSESGKRWGPLIQKNLDHEMKAQFQQPVAALLSAPTLMDALPLSIVPQHIECFDISHTSGQYTVASCVVFDASGPNKRAYRTYKVPFLDKPDDYASLAFVIKKRYSKKKEKQSTIPDLIIVDGGIGQRNVLMHVLDECMLGHIPILAISKGPSRKAGQEKLHTRTHDLLKLDPHLPAFRFLMQIRDESHRFAIKHHRQIRDKQSLQFIIERIPGIGPTKRKKLYQHFGGLAGIKKATVEDLCRVDGIYKGLAVAIYRFFHEP